MKKLVVLCAVLVLATGPAWAALIIDDFEDGDFFLLVTPSTGSDSDQQTGSMIGGIRTVDILGVTTTGSGGNAQAEVASDNPDVLDDALSYSNSDQVTSTLVLTYGGPSNPLDANLSVEPYIDLHLRSIDLETGISVKLTSGIGTLGEASHTVSDTASDPGFFPFTLADYAAAGVNLSDIDEIVVTISGDPALDLSIDLISATDVVPEPATLSLLCIGLLAAARARRKRS